MKILVVGSGGREHAIGWKLKQNLSVELYFAPGNGGTEEIGENVNIKINEIDKLIDFAKQNEIDMTVIGPEAPLTMGIADEFNKNGLRVFGPSAEGAKLEGSKTYAKQFMNKYDIPTAKYDVVTSIEDGLNVLEESSYPIVLKADGLAAGKGVIICDNKEQAETTLRDILDTGIFGDAGSSVVIEEFLVGKEVSLLCFTDGETIIPMETASDYKRALDNDMGVNTGGMGSISPSPYYTPGLGDEIAQKTLHGIKSEGIDYRGVIYIGLILTPDGPKVLEYNVRFGDPETEALLPRLKTDLIKVMSKTIDKQLAECNLYWSSDKAVTVIMTSKGYPDKYDVGFDITIPETKSIAFHAGTSKVNSDSCNKVVTAGGRVLAVTALGESFDDARKTVYQDVANIVFQGSTYRKDIGVVV
ncbi:MAG: phosphoribosylamine--glycine ligase [Oscillospiraceae bacterium]|nr:phosphoribosylamine--glycine ligase [Oscillospiraceae bacterium]